MLDRCFAYDDLLRKNGHFAGGEALQGPYTATNLKRWKNGKAIVTDGPFAETKEQLGGHPHPRSARDLNHAIQLMSKHPGVKAGPLRRSAFTPPTSPKCSAKAPSAAPTSRHNQAEIRTIQHPPPLAPSDEDHNARSARLLWGSYIVVGLGRPLGWGEGFGVLVKMRPSPIFLPHVLPDSFVIHSLEKSPPLSPFPSP